MCMKHVIRLRNYTGMSPATSVLKDKVVIFFGLDKNRTNGNVHIVLQSGSKVKLSV
jgi:hypothetical protein